MKANYTNKLSIKLISIGDVEVGKSCLIKRYCEGSFVSDYITTIGIDYGVKTVPFNDSLVAINIFDPQEVAYKQRLFERRRRNFIVLTDESENEIYQNERISNRIDPAHNGANCLVFRVFPDNSDLQKSYIKILTTLFKTNFSSFYKTEGFASFDSINTLFFGY